MAQTVLVMVAGPNGSGKTTLTRHLQASGFDLGEYINPDDIAAMLDGDPVQTSREAQRLAEIARQSCMARGVSFAFETVMSHPSKVELLKQAKGLGCYVVLFLWPSTILGSMWIASPCASPKEAMTFRWNSSSVAMIELWRCCLMPCMPLIEVCFLTIHIAMTTGAQVFKRLEKSYTGMLSGCYGLSPNTTTTARRFPCHGGLPRRSLQGMPVAIKQISISA